MVHKYLYNFISMIDKFLKLYKGTFFLILFKFVYNILNKVLNINIYFLIIQNS